MSNQTQKHTLLGKLSLTHVNAPNNYVNTQMQYDQHYDWNQETKSLTNQSNLMPNMGLYGNFTLTENQQLETTLQGSYTKNKYFRTYSEGTYTTYSDTKEDLYELRGNVNYSLRSKQKNSLTAQLRYMHKISTVLYTGDQSSEQQLWTGQTTFSMQYTQRFGEKINMQITPGFSILQYQLKEEKRICQISPRLKLILTYRPTRQQQLRTNIAIGNSHPNISRLNNMDQHVDSMTVMRGNPTLDITRFLNAEIGYSLQVGSFNIQTAGMCRYYTHIPTDDYYIENDKLIHSFHSNGNAYEVMTLLAGSWKATDNLHLKAEANWMRISLYGSIPSEALNRWSGSAQ